MFSAWLNIIFCVYSDITLWHTISISAHYVHSKIKNKMLLKMSYIIIIRVTFSFGCNLFVTLRGLIIKLYSTKLRLGMQTSDFWQLLRKNKSIELEWNKTLPIMHQWECMPYSLIFPPQALIRDSSPLDLSYHRWRIPEGVVTHLLKTNICFTLFWRKKSLFYSFWLRWVKSTLYFEVMLGDGQILIATISLTGVYFC